jgi:asparagine synthase (glutamine-hydrolysing)
MCGIWCLTGTVLPISEEDAHRLINNTLSGRGPEGGRVVSFNNNLIMGFTRLAINGLTSAGMQPFTHNGITVICNGEIYNYKEIARKYGFTLTTGSDCEVLPLLYERLIDHPAQFWQELDGVFAAAIYDANRSTLMVGRDPYGVRPLFIGTAISANRFQDYEYVGFASEIKGLQSIPFDSIYQFTPGHYATYDLGTLSLMDRDKYHSYPDEDAAGAPIKDIDLAKRYIRSTLMQAVHKRMLTERPVAALLSGGIDSSLIAALVQRELVAAGAPPLKTFSIGFEGSEDVRYAKMVADHIGSEHHEIIMTPDDFFAAIPEVIKDIESFDTTTVRASVGNWLVAREIRRRTDCKVVFNGDGSDEAFGSYMYFYKAPTDEAYEAESVRLLKDICYFDVLRSDRSISSHGLEPRTPFLDKNFVSTVHRIDVGLRRPISGYQPEKWLLRSAFDGMDLLPSQVLWRKKEAFSDGVSGPKKLWYQEIQERIQNLTPPATGGHMDPKTPEDIYYRSIFESLYKDRGQVIPYKWMPRWIEGATDPSARTLKVYEEAS